MAAVVDVEKAQAAQIRFKAITVTAKTDLPRMAESQYLNDSLVDFFTQLGMSVLNEEKANQDVFCFSTHFFSKLTDNVQVAKDGYNNVKRWSRKVQGG